MNQREFQRRAAAAYARWAGQHADQIPADPSLARPGKTDLPLHHATMAAPADTEDGYWDEIDQLLEQRDREAGTQAA